MSNAEMSSPEVKSLDKAHALRDKLGSSFLGLREDRGEVTVWVESAAWIRAASFLKTEQGCRVLSDLTAVDYLDREPRFDLSAILLDHYGRQDLRLKTMLPEEDARAESLSDLWPGAGWFEREIYDLFGISFDNHPDLRRILLPEDYQGNPLRKDYPVTGPATSVYR